jgi:hypothetical protein
MNSHFASVVLWFADLPVHWFSSSGAIMNVRALAIYVGVSCLALDGYLAVSCEGQQWTQERSAIMALCGILIGASSFAFFSTLKSKP